MRVSPPSDRRRIKPFASQTDALIQYARTHGYHVPPEWRFQDEGYSGDSLQRPGLEAIRDLAAEGKISAVLVYSPDRLSRKYTYQVVLSEEFLRCGVQLVFLQSPSTQTPEDRLAVQLQGMIAEYERPQIAERTRRGKRHRAQQERPRSEWIEVPVPALISEQTFALAQQQLGKNKQFASRRTLVPTLLQGMLVCRQCGYALCRTATRSGGRTVYYYRCTGAQARHQRSGTACSSRSVRQDFIDPLVWQEILRLLEDSSLIQAEIQRRIEEARNADPRQQRRTALEQEQARLQNSIDRLILAYQEQLLTLEQLRQRLPELQQRQKAVAVQLQSLLMAAADQSRYLRVVETIDQFRDRLRAHAQH